MKVAVITSNLMRTSGLGRLSVEVIERMAAQPDIDLTVCVEKGTGKSYEQVVLSGKRTIWNLLRDTVRVRKIVRDADVVHAFDVSPYGLIGYLAVLFTKKRFIVSGIGTYTIAPLDSWKLGWIMRKMYARSFAIPTISAYVANEVIKRVPGVYAPVVHMGTTPMKKLSDDAHKLYAEKYPLTGRHPVLLTVGAVKDRKGQYDTVVAMKEITKRYPNATYYIVGSVVDSGGYVQRIKAYTKKHGLDVRIVNDAKEDEALAYFYQSADIFVLASNNGHGHVEGFGLVFLEANQYGVPGVGTKECGIEDAVNSGESGVLVKQRAPKEISEAVFTIMENYKHYSNGAKKWHPHFSWDTTVSQYIELYKR